MRLTPIALALATIRVFTACASSDENIPTTEPTATLPGDGIIICPQVGGVASPATSTPIPSCALGSNLDLLPGIRGHVTLPPQYPDGAEPVTEYLELTDNAGISATIALPIHWPAPTGTVASWYTYANNSWTRLQPADLADNQLKTLVSGHFDTLPPNLIVLAETQ